MIPEDAAASLTHRGHVSLVTAHIHGAAVNSRVTFSVCHTIEVRAEPAPCSCPHALQVSRRDRDLPAKASMNPHVLEASAILRLRVQLGFELHFFRRRNGAQFGGPNRVRFHHERFAIRIERIGHGNELQ